MTHHSNVYKLLDTHMRDTMCGGDMERYSALLDWMSHLVKYPDRHGRQVLVLRGGQGVGKSLFTSILCGLLNPTEAITVTHGSPGMKFNSYLRGIRLLVLDYPVDVGRNWSGDMLKSMISDDEICIETKGIAAELIPNRLNMVLITNRELSGVAERRLLTIDFAPGPLANEHFFKDMLDQLAQGGWEALQADLKNREVVA